MTKLRADVKAARDKAYEAKWAELKRRGLKPPKDEKERQERLKAAHDVV